MGGAALVFWGDGADRKRSSKQTIRDERSERRCAVASLELLEATALRIRSIATA